MVDPKKRDRAAAPQRLRMAAIGMEAECALLLDGLRFGSIEIQVHDGRVVSIERRERVRLVPARPAESALHS